MATAHISGEFSTHLAFFEKQIYLNEWKSVSTLYYLSWHISFHGRGKDLPISLRQPQQKASLGVDMSNGNRILLPAQKFGTNIARKEELRDSS